MRSIKTCQVRRYPLISSPSNNIIQDEGKGEEVKKPAEISPIELDEDLMRVSTLFEEQNSIETLLSEIREIDIASLVRLRTVAELNQNMLDRGQEEQVNDEEEEDFSLNIDLRSKPSS